MKKGIIIFTAVVLLSGLIYADPLETNERWRGACSVLNDINIGVAIDNQFINEGGYAPVFQLNIRHDIVPFLRPQLSINFTRTGQKAKFWYPETFTLQRTSININILIYPFKKIWYIHPGLGVANNYVGSLDDYTLLLEYFPDADYYYYADKYNTFSLGTGFDLPLLWRFYLSVDGIYVYHFKKFKDMPPIGEYNNYFAVSISLFYDL